ncbi:hypothetical protein [Rahnella aceris]|uniref:Uncharacterized protein n=1 Tax=Rahnella sp. (strain Y9602) TaxID=2703885 RepID=A0ABW6CMD0_RAHSY
MSGTRWRDVSFNGKNYDLKHLHPFGFQVEMSGSQVSISVSFGNHVFTDEKGTGIPLFPSPERYFCPDRHAASINLPKMISERLMLSHVVPHINKSNNEVYYYCEVNDYAIFFDLRKDDNTADALTLFVISAYELDQWGKSSVPRGTAVRFSYIAHLRLAGTTYFMSKKANKAKRHP